ncbi:MAG: hypothetical protein HY042_08890 [Spirochaetia bacterium]|nr:hypothetical protein [Spirochaetia bacterium]
MFFLYEAVAGRPVPLRAMDAVYRLGFGVLLMFGLWITYKDILSWVGF